MSCALCNTRRPRRFCPGVQGDICGPCCGAEREVSITCPMDCEYLRDSRKHDYEKAPPLDPALVPHKSIQIPERFLGDHGPMLAFLGYSIAEAALRIPGAYDSDAREALDALVRTRITLESGLYYESVPTNPLAAGIFRAAQEAAIKFREREKEELGFLQTRDADVLMAFAFLQRLEMDRNNGRPRCRAFLDLMSSAYSELPRAEAGEAEPSGLILP